jgi:hypothetical protein
MSDLCHLTLCAFNYFFLLLFISFSLLTRYLLLFPALLLSAYLSLFPYVFFRCPYVWGRPTRLEDGSRTAGGYTDVK